MLLGFILLRLLPAVLQWHKTRHFNLKITIYIYIVYILPDSERKREGQREREYCALNSQIYLNNGIYISILQTPNFYYNFFEQLLLRLSVSWPQCASGFVGLWVAESTGQWLVHTMVFFSIHVVTRCDSFGPSRPLLRCNGE